jgi:hypothetical protein
VITNTATVSNEPEPDAEPDDEMRRAFTEQLTEALVRDLHRYARQRSKLIVMAGRKPDRHYAKDLVQEALIDILAGTVAWDPASCCLRDRVIWLMKERSFRDAQWLERLQHVDLEDADERAAIQAQGSHRMSASPQDEAVAMKALLREVIERLRVLAGNDDPVRRLLDAWSDGLIERMEILPATSLSAAEYKTARARLLYLVDDLPQELKNRVTDLLRDAS